MRARQWVRAGHDACPAVRSVDARDGRAVPPIVLIDWRRVVFRDVRLEGFPFPQFQSTISSGAESAAIVVDHYITMQAFHAIVLELHAGEVARPSTGILRVFRYTMIDYTRDLEGPDAPNADQHENGYKS